MTKKRVTFGAKPSAAKADSPNADTWVQGRAAEPMKRLTIDVPTSLHARHQGAMRLPRLQDGGRGQGLAATTFPARLNP